MEIAPRLRTRREMQKHNIQRYNKAAEIYRPNRVKVLFIAESPPSYASTDKMSYFFFDQNPGSDILFATIIKAVFDVNYHKADGNKAELLRRFRRKGFWLLDAVNVPINKLAGQRTSPKERNCLISNSIPDLLGRLDRLKKRGVIDYRTGIILIKKIVYQILSPVLITKGYNVLNSRHIDFPKYYRDRDTIREIRLVSQEAGIALFF